MHIHKLETWRHGHNFVDHDANRESERRTLLVVALTAVMMVAEIGAGYLFGSMALMADGWHMATHAGALGITVLAYRYARHHHSDPRFTFGVGKVEALGGFASAIVLGIVALWVVWESLQRLLSPQSIAFNEAILVAVVGLAVNLFSAWLLQGGPGHSHAHTQTNHADHSHHTDHNLRAAYLHVLADALTSVLAIIALICGKLFGWVWMDAVIGIVGAVIIGKWAYGLLADTGTILLDGAVSREKADEVRAAIEADADNRVVDLHLWRVGPDRLGVIVSLVTHYPSPPDHYKALLRPVGGLAHITVEVNVCTDAPCIPVATG